jgi:gamma-glutamylcyclotransferase (GGCT)/AIG2-like uncharacterized protein YtfP
MIEPVGIFVYGTLKQGERNFMVSRQAGWLRSEAAFVEGFQLYHIPQRERLPYAYPAVVRGEGQGFADLAQALVLLDPLEDEGREYLRISTLAHSPDQAGQHPVWIYVYPGMQSIQAVSGRWLPDGVWREMEGQKG